MNEVTLTLDDLAALAALRMASSRRTRRDAGAAAVHAGAGIAERFRRAATGPLYAEGLALATTLAGRSSAAGFVNSRHERLQRCCARLRTNRRRFSVSFARIPAHFT
jgi:hypothetical protein